MITVVRSLEAMPGKLLDAMTCGREISTITKRVHGHDVKFSVAFGGHSSAVAWIAEFDNGSQVEEAGMKLVADAEYATAAKKMADIAVPGTQRDHFWKSM